MECVVALFPSCIYTESLPIISQSTWIKHVYRFSECRQIQLNYITERHTYLLFQEQVGWLSLYHPSRKIQKKRLTLIMMSSVVHADIITVSKYRVLFTCRIDCCNVSVRAKGIGIQFEAADKPCSHLYLYFLPIYNSYN